jgi:hypothetical protein
MSIFNFTSFEWMLNLWVGDFQKPINELGAAKNVQEDRVWIIKRVPGYDKVKKNTTQDASRVNWQITNVNFLHHYFQASAFSWSGMSYLLAGSNNWSDYTLRYRTTGDWLPLLWSWASASTSISSSASHSPSSSPSASISNSPSRSLSSSPSPSPAPTSAGTYTWRANAELSAINYLDKAFIIWYDATDKEYLAPATIEGTLFSTTDSDITGMPSGRFIVRYRDLPYVLYAKISSTVYPSRAYYPADPVNMAIPTWGWDTPYNFEQFGQDDWDEITGWAEAYDKLVVFKTNSMWTYDQESVKKIADVGCDSYKSIKVINGILYWSNRNWIWRWAGDLPQLISGKVQPLIDAVDQTKIWEEVASNYWFEYRLFIWDVTHDWNTYTNCWICFDVRREKFYVRCTIHKPLSSTKYVESGAERMYFWSDTGYVYKQSTYVDGVNGDDWNEIDYFFVTNAFDFWAPQVVKNSPTVYFFTRNCAWMKHVFDVDCNWTFNISNWQIDSSNIHPTEINATGNRLTAKFYWKDKNKPFEFEWFVVDISWIENVETK